jgi:hypothetical protein
MLNALNPVARTRTSNARSLFELAPSTLFSSSSNRWFAARLGTRTDGSSTTCAAPPADTRRVVLARSI